MKRLWILMLACLTPLQILCAQDSGAVINDGYGGYAFVPAGQFLMGDNAGDGAADERPVHKVSSDACYIGVHEVTNGEYRKFVDDGGYANKAFWSAGGFGKLGCQPYHWANPAYKGGGLAGNKDYPVVGVSWFEARAYCAWLSVKTGKTYRLPTEAEWEKAARGTDQRRYPWGETIDESRARFFNRDNLAANGLAPVGWYDGTRRGDLLTRSNASPYGAYDMAGNVFEWCEDWYDRQAYRASEAPLRDARDGGQRTRVVRGGSWDYNGGNPLALRATARMSYTPSGRYSNTGFRCVREP